MFQTEIVSQLPVSSGASVEAADFFQSICFHKYGHKLWWSEILRHVVHVAQNDTIVTLNPAGGMKSLYHT
jgi:hypothetical protein